MIGRLQALWTLRRPGEEATPLSIAGYAIDVAKLYAFVQLGYLIRDVLGDLVGWGRWLLAFFLMVLVLTPLNGEAQTGNEESICQTAAVFMCENFQDRAKGNAGSVLGSALYKNPAWAVSAGCGSDCTVEDGVGPQGTTVHLLRFHCPTPAVNPANDNGCTGFMDDEFGTQTNIYVRWYTKWSANYLWSIVSTKHFEFNTTNSGLLHTWSSNFDFDHGPPEILLPLGFTKPHFQTQGLDGTAGTWDQNITPNKTITAGDGWHCFEGHLQVTGGTWTLEGWIDNVKQVNYVGSALWLTAGTAPHGWLLSGQWNCYNNSCTSGFGNQHAPFDRYHTNIVASTSRVGCLGFTPPPPPTPSVPTRLFLAGIAMFSLVMLSRFIPHLVS